MSFRRVSDGGEADALRGHALRYPWGEHAPAAREAELAAAFSLADGAGEAAGWQRLLDRYPEHPRRDEARQRLEESSWDEFREAGGGGGELWAFVAEHPDSDEGWNAAVEAMGQTVRVLVPGGAAATGTLDSVLASLTVEMGVTPPPGYELGIEVEVDLGEGWVDWSAAAGTLAGPLALGDGALTGLGALSDARMSGETIAWSTPTPVCAAFAGPVPVRARVTMIHRDRRHEQTSAFQVAGPCPGARRMVLSQLGDDLRGPVALVVRETESGLDRVAAPPSVMHETWTCSHVTAVEPLGVTLACGKTTARLGWDEGVMWLRRTDPSVPTTERVALTPVADLPGTPLTVVTPRRGRPPVLQDSAGGTWADLGDREAVATPALAPSAFGAVPGATAATPPVPPGKERPVEGSSVPLPEGAARRSVEVDGLSSSDIRRWAATVNALGLTGAAPKQLLAIDGDAPGGIDRAVLANVFTQDVGGLMQVHGMLLAAEGEGEFDWYQAVLLPGLGDLSRAHWERFELDGHVYLRTAGPSPVDGACTRLFTLRDGGGHLVVDLTDLDCR
jgi:hypothetical protein